MSLCRECDLVHADTRKLTPFKWRCVKAPRPLEADPKLRLVDPDWHPDPPYHLCTTVVAQLPNDECEHFQPRRLPKEPTE